MGAAAHRDRAANDRAAAEGVEAGNRSLRVQDDSDWRQETFNLTQQAIANNYRRHAEQHLRIARALESAEFGACLSVPHSERGECPVLHNVERIDTTRRGILFVLRPGVAPETAVADFVCHHAFGRTHGFPEMPECPLYVSETRVRQIDDRHVELIGTSSDAVHELWKRTRTFKAPPNVPAVYRENAHPPRAEPNPSTPKNDNQ